MMRRPYGGGSWDGGPIGLPRPFAIPLKKAPPPSILWATLRRRPRTIETPGGLLLSRAWSAIKE